MKQWPILPFLYEKNKLFFDWLEKIIFTERGNIKIACFSEE